MSSRIRFDESTLLRLKLRLKLDRAFSSFGQLTYQQCLCVTNLSVQLSQALHSEHIKRVHDALSR